MLYVMLYFDPHGMTTWNYYQYKTKQRAQEQEKYSIF